MKQKLEYAKTLARFPLALRRFVPYRLTLEEAKRIVQKGMQAD